MLSTKAPGAEQWSAPDSQELRNAHLIMGGVNTWKTDCDWICHKRRGQRTKDISQGTFARRDLGQVAEGRTSSWHCCVVSLLGVLCYLAFC